MRHWGAAVLAVAAVAATGADAHTLGNGAAGLAHGFAHPLAGPDHVLAMVAVGLWASQLGGRALWQVPLAFVGAMALGGGIALAGGWLPAVELGIAGSILVLGVIVALAARLPVWLSAALVGFFVLFHGLAHGVEMPGAASAALYGLGFIGATAVLHGIGIVLGLYLLKRSAQWGVRLGGAGVTAAGIVLLVV